MTGVLYIEEAKVEATTGMMLITFRSGGDPFRFHLPAHVALKLRQAIMRDGWEVCCSPEPVVPLRLNKRAKIERRVKQ